MGLFARSRVLLAGAALALAASLADAQSYPTKPIRVILPFAGGTDAVARLLAVKLAPALGQQLVPEPRLGAGGNIAHELVAKAPPDGYTLLMAAPPLVINPHLNKVAYDPLRDLVPIALLTAIPNVLVVHPSVPAKSVAELVALARKEPGKLTYGSGGVGSSNHLAAEMMKAVTRTDIVHVPYKSATHALTAAVGGETNIVIVAASSAAPFVRDGRMRALAVLDTKRSSAMPEVPTAAEAGLPQVVVVNWYILLAPAGTPRAIVQRLNVEAVKAMNDPETRTRLAGLGGEPASGTPEQTAELLRREYEQWGKVIREAGIKAE
jgi:tripartite-type tricarboxylate transporter receptor subunit TctC